MKTKYEKGPVGFLKCLADEDLNLRKYQLATTPVAVVQSATGAAQAAVSAGPAQPRHADALPLGEAFDQGAVPHHRADDLMPEDQRQARRWQLAIEDVKICPAHARAAHAHQQLRRPWFGNGKLLLDERTRRPLEHHGAHAGCQRQIPRWQT